MEPCYYYISLGIRIVADGLGLLYNSYVYAHMQVDHWQIWCMSRAISTRLGGDAKVKSFVVISS